MEKPLVSIWCITYNHAPYIRDAIEGFLMQKTTFPFEIVIHDDASTDGTTEILKEYEEKYPDLFNIIYEEENTYNRKDKGRMYYEIKKKYLKGKYVALCEGDDYWTNPNKLQMQIDYMEANAECMMTAHNAEMIHYVENKIKLMNPYSGTGRLTAEQVIRQSNGIAPTASFVVRKEAILMIGFFIECGIGDWPLQLHCITMGYIYYFDEVMSRYRFLHNGSWSSTVRGMAYNNIPHSIRMIIFLQKYDEYTNGKFKKWIRHRIHCYINNIAMASKEIEDSEFENIVKVAIESNDEEMHDLIIKIYEIANDIKIRNFVTKGFTNFHKSEKAILIWGAGVYAKECSKQYEKEGIKILGYVVSKKEADKDCFLGKPVWEVEKQIDLKKDAEIVVAVRVNLWQEIETKIKEMEIVNYYYPYQLY